MKFLKRTGCIVGTLEVDDIETYNMTDDKKLEILDVMFDYVKHNLNGFDNLLETFIETYGDYSCDDEPCECCGDYVDEYNLELNY